MPTFQLFNNFLMTYARPSFFLFLILLRRSCPHQIIIVICSGLFFFFLPCSSCSFRFTSSRCNNTRLYCLLSVLLLCFRLIFTGIRIAAGILGLLTSGLLLPRSFNLLQFILPLLRFLLYLLVSFSFLLELTCSLFGFKFHFCLFIEGQACLKLLFSFLMLLRFQMIL